MLERIVEFSLTILIPICELMGIVIVAVSVLSRILLRASETLPEMEMPVMGRIPSGPWR